MYYINIGFLYVIIGFACALAFVFVLRNDAYRRFWLAALIAIVGSFLGGVLDYFLGDFLEELTNLAGAVNLYPAVAVSLLTLWLVSLFNRD